jgi:Uma2 family endonuclease
MMENLQSQPVALPSPGIQTNRMSYDEFLERADEFTWAEWVNGEVIVLSPASQRHQLISGFLNTILRLFIEVHSLGEVLIAPFQMKLGPNLSGREPDLLFISNKNKDRLKANRLDGPADLVIEIISPESFIRDRGEKYIEYEMAGVKEYWIIDPIRKQAEFYFLEDGMYQLAYVEKDGIFHSREIDGLWIDVNWLWQDPLPPTLPILKQLNIL